MNTQLQDVLTKEILDLKRENATLKQTILALEAKIFLHEHLKGPPRIAVINQDPQDRFQISCDSRQGAGANAGLRSCLHS